MGTKNAVRRFDLDWLRIIGILSVFLYHSTRFFNLDYWHIKNVNTYAFLQIFTRLMDVWMMPFIFFISGASIFFALEKSGLLKYIKDKFFRLGIPLLVGMFSHGLLQVYLERISHGQFTGSLLDFIPHYFEGFYGFGGNFAWTAMHLWYLLFLLIFSLIFLPLFIFLKSMLGSKILEKFTNLFSLPGLAVLLVFPVVLCENFIDPNGFLGNFDGQMAWSMAAYMSYFVLGFVVISNNRLQASIQKTRWISLVLLIASTICFQLTNELRDVMAWCIILTFLGFGMKYLAFSNRFQKYANEAVLPFYILHQPVLLTIGFFVFRLPIPDLLKWVVILFISLLIILGIYEYGIRRFNLVRFLFGMKQVKKQAA